MRQCHASERKTEVRREARRPYTQYLVAATIDDAEAAVRVHAAVGLDAVDALAFLVVARTSSPSAAPAVVDGVVGRATEHVRLTLVHRRSLQLQP